MNVKALTIAAVALSVGYTVDYNPRPSQPGTKSISPISFKVSEANAQTASQNAARRTARRTSRRVNRRHNIAGCTPYNGYYNCGGTYYQAITEDGKTVYVVVNP
ncbi:hypothetical protein PSE_2235 [Pseudovibrio sp. FO-BEG1]|uniref:Uncharacterized protein n=1 Tax=Pseudovibrio denitrificans TaxID=258256 RepID=A0A1I7DFW6_9HYPH|nr:MULTISPECIES: hypothetical protein [Pseudovibrio]AEV36745.1 hypothetical protein PSE_2235 [Pseudovibrio sp. FO-BEG1]SFU10564.1 hypothetical protein SAMN05444141_108309 [Pseudovibrio denitrificans]